MRPLSKDQFAALMKDIFGDALEELDETPRHIQEWWDVVQEAVGELVIDAAADMDEAL